MIGFRCQCGTGHSVRESVAGDVSACPVCHKPLRLVCAGPAPPEANFSHRLVAVAGPRPAGEQLLLGGAAPIEFGKLPGKPLLLAGNLVSRNHGRLAPTAEGWRLEDAGSTNGSFVNGHRVTSHDLRDGDRVRIGEFEFEYHGGVSGITAGTAAEKAEAGDELGAYEAAYDLAEPEPAPAARAHARGGTRYTPPLAGGTPGVAVGPPLASYAPTRYAPGPPLPCPTCPSCLQTLGSGAKICVACGINVRTGRPIITAHGLDEDALHIRGENTLRVISWVIRFGFYPIASEAYGAFKPYAIWAIAALTVLTSVLFWVAGDTHRGPGRDLPLWAGKPSAEVVDVVYTDEDVHLATDEDRKAFAQKMDDLDGKVPDDQLPLTAYKALPDERQVFGHFQPHQLLTHAFLHGGILHLVGNLLFLLVFGSRVNALVGQWKAALLYPLLAIIAGGAYALSQMGKQIPVPMVGASGAIMGLAGMYLVLFPVHRVHNVIWLRLGLFTGFRLWFKIFALRGFWVVLFFIAFDVVFTLLRIEDQVAHWVHLGGFLGGMAVALVLLLTRVVDARGGDLLSVVLGKRAWPLLGTPAKRGRRTAPLAAQPA